jgi:hypothetical protein
LFPLYAKGSIGSVTAIAGLPFSDTAIPPMETDLKEMINHTPLMKDEPIKMFSLMHFIDDHLFQNCWTPAEAQMFDPSRPTRRIAWLCELRPSPRIFNLGLCDGYAPSHDGSA